MSLVMAAESADFRMQLLDFQPYFCDSAEVLRERSELQNKFLLRCARILKGLQSAKLTGESFASEDFGSDSCQTAYSALLELFRVKQDCGL